MSIGSVEFVARWATNLGVMKKVANRATFWNRAKATQRVANLLTMRFNPRWGANSKGKNPAQWALNCPKGFRRNSLGRIIAPS